MSIVVPISEQGAQPAKSSSPTRKKFGVVAALTGAGLVIGGATRTLAFSSDASVASTVNAIKLALPAENGVVLLEKARPHAQPAARVPSRLNIVYKGAICKQLPVLPGVSSCPCGKEG